MRTQARLARMAYLDALGGVLAMFMTMLAGIIFLVAGAILGVLEGGGQLFTWYTAMMLLGLGVSMMGARYVTLAAHQLTHTRAQYRYYRYATNKTKENHARMAKAIAKTIVPYAASETAAWRSPTDDMHPVR